MTENAVFCFQIDLRRSHSSLAMWERRIERWKAIESIEEKDDYSDDTYSDIEEKDDYSDDTYSDSDVDW